MFDMKVGEFLEEDPTGFEAGQANEREYCGNSPINGTDPSGLEIQSNARIDDYLSQFIDCPAPQPASEADTMCAKWAYAGRATVKAGLQGDNALAAEILASMVNSGFTYVLKGDTAVLCKTSIKDHVRARVAIVRNAESTAFSFGPSTVALPNQETIMGDYFRRVNKEATFLECRAATQIVFYAGIGIDGGKGSWMNDSAYRRVDGDVGLDVVPGDWVYIKNTANKTYTDANGVRHQDPNWRPGLEGENTIYVGDDLYWGHLAPENTREMLEWWETKVVNHWQGKDKSQGFALVEPEVQFPTVGLDVRKMEETGELLAVVATGKVRKIKDR